jgi:hypothetical protein
MLLEKKVKKPTKTTIVGIGGTGINNLVKILRTLYSTGEKLPFGFPEITAKAIDITSSNLSGVSEYISENNITVIPNVDGSGKVQGDAAKAVVQYLDAIVKGIDGELIILIFGASGGAGAGLGIPILGELMSRSQFKTNTAIITYVVGSTVSEIEASNCKNTLMLLEGLSGKYKMPVITAFYENTKEVSRDDVDNRINDDVRSLLTLCSGVNGEADGADIVNFCRYDRVKLPKPLLPRMTFMYTHRGSHENIPAYTDVYGVVSLLQSTSDPVLSIKQSYSSVGYLPPELVSISEAAGKGIPEINIILTNCYQAHTLIHLNEYLNEFTEQTDRMNTMPKIEAPLDPMAMLLG